MSNITILGGISILYKKIEIRNVVGVCYFCSLYICRVNLLCANSKYQALPTSAKICYTGSPTWTDWVESIFGSTRNELSTKNCTSYVNFVGTKVHKQVFSWHIF